MNRILALSLSALLVAAGLSAQAKDEPKPYTDNKTVDLLVLLPAPAPADSPRFKADLEAVLAVQKSRTKAQADRAVADDAENVWRFADAVDNPNFTPDKLPAFSAFFDRVVATEPAVVDPAKDAWKRPRPYMADARVTPLLKKKSSGAYPSGHTTIGTLMGIILANMLPEKEQRITDRAREFANNRIVAGMHVPSDIEAGKFAGTAIAAVLFTKADFLADYEAAKAELRKALGY